MFRKEELAQFERVSKIRLGSRVIDYPHRIEGSGRRAFFSFWRNNLLRRCGEPVGLQIFVLTRTASAPSETVSKRSNAYRFASRSANSKNALASPVVASCVQSSK